MHHCHGRRKENLTYTATLGEMVEAIQIDAQTLTNQDLWKGNSVWEAHIHAKHVNIRGFWGMPPRKVWNFLPSKIESEGIFHGYLHLIIFLSCVFTFTHVSDSFFTVVKTNKGSAFSFPLS